MTTSAPLLASARRTRFLPGLWLAACALVLATVAPAQTPSSREYQIKAAFLFNFLPFVEWPAASFAQDGAPLRIGVLGDDPFGSALDDTMRNETVHGRKLVIQRSHRVEDLQGCHLLFISKSESRRVNKILSLLDGPVLTVSELDGFARQGGIIAFYPDGKKVRFEINPDTARRANLKLSSQLLELGRIVPTSTGGN